MTPLILPRPALIQWNNVAVSDHNRSDMSVEFTPIETVKRMANGTMRKYVVATKRQFRTSWKDLPNTNDNTVDGFMGGEEMELFYSSTPGPFTLKLTSGAGAVEVYTVMLSSFSKEISKRGIYDFWNVDVEMIEV